MGSLTYAQAVAILRNREAPGNEAYRGTAGLVKLVSETSAEAPGASKDAVTLLYSGKIGDVPAWQVAESIAQQSNGQIVTVAMTHQGKLLDSRTFKDALDKGLTREGMTPDDKTIYLNGGKTSTGIEVRGLWDIASEALVRNAGEIASLTGGRGTNPKELDTESKTVYRLTEVPTAIKLGKSINGVPAEELARLPLEDAVKRVDEASRERMKDVEVAFDASGQVIPMDPARNQKWAKGISSGHLVPGVSVDTMGNVPGNVNKRKLDDLIKAKEAEIALAQTLTQQPPENTLDAKESQILMSLEGEVAPEQMAGIMMHSEILDGGAPADKLDGTFGEMVATVDHNINGLGQSARDALENENPHMKSALLNRVGHDIDVRKDPSGHADAGYFNGEPARKADISVNNDPEPEM